MATRATGGSPKVSGRAAAVGDRYMQLVRRFPLRVIATEAELDASTEVIHSLAGQYDTDTDEYRRALAALIERYEVEHYPMGESVTPAGMVRHLMEARGVDEARVVADSGLASSTLSEILSGKRGISRRVRATLAVYFRVDPGVFL